MRDQIIGVRVALADGTIARGGGKVVKNVAGYDLPKLYTGALGTLGVVLSASFRLYPIPPFTGSALVEAPALEPLVRAGAIGAGAAHHAHYPRPLPRDGEWPGDARGPLRVSSGGSHR